MKEVDIQSPNGYLMDSDGNVCLKFGNWKTTTHTVPDYVESVEYVEGPKDHGVTVHDKYKRDGSE